MTKTLLLILALIIECLLSCEGTDPKYNKKYSLTERVLIGISQEPRHYTMQEIIDGLPFSEGKKESR